MTYDVGDLHGVWANLDDDSLLELEEDGDFKLTSAGDGPVAVSRRVNAVSGVSGKWTLEDGEFKITINLRSMRLSSPSWFMAISVAVFSFLLRFAKEREMIYGKITHLTGTDLWIENSQGIVNKFQKE